MNEKKAKRIRRERRMEFRRDHAKWERKRPLPLFFISYLKWKKQEPKVESYV